MPSGDDGRLLDLLEEWERRLAAGEQPTPEDLAEGDAQLADELRAALADLEGARWLDQDAVRDDSLVGSGATVGEDSFRSTSRPLFGASESTNGGSKRVANGAAERKRRKGRDRSGESSKSQPSHVGHRYEILSHHAHGGLGVVFRARDQEFDREVALKSVRHDRTLDEVRRAKFRREAKITGCLEHPGIVPVYSLGVDDRGEPYYAMRFVQGEDLKSCLDRFHSERVRDRRPLDGAELRSLLRRFLAVCDAVGYAHDQGVVHRDLKPGNIMLGEHGETLVVDWGLAKRFMALSDEEYDSRRDRPLSSNSSESEKTADGTLLGTPAYAPPEQLTGRTDEIGPASDVYSLGVLLYEILTGSRPVESDSLGDLVAKIEQGKHVPARERLREVPAALDAICRRAYAVDPLDRYASANLLKEDVEAWLDDRPVSANPDSLADRCFRWTRRHPALATGFSISLVVTLVAATAIVWIDNRRQSLELAAERADFAREQAEATATTERYYKERGELSDLISGRPAGWTLQAPQRLAKLRETSLSSKPAERVHLASSEWTASLGRELIKEPWPLDDVGYQPYRAILSPDKKLLALPQSRAGAWIWFACKIADARTGEVSRQLSYEEFPELPDFESIFETTKPITQDGMRAAGFSDDGAWIAMGLRHGSLLIWELGQTPDDSPMVFESGTSVSGEEIVWLVDDRSFVASFGDELQLWKRDGDSFRKAATASIAGRSSKLVREPNANRILFVADGQVRAIDGETLESVEVGSTEWSGQQPGSGFVGFNGDVGVQVFDLADPTASFTLLPYDIVGPDARVRPASFSSDGTLAVVGVESDDQNSILLLDVASGEVLSRVKVRSGNDVVPVFADDETVLLVGAFGVSRWHVRGTGAHRAIAMSARSPADLSWAAEGDSGLVALANRIVSLRVGPTADVLESQSQSLPGDWRVRVSPAGDQALLMTAAEDSQCMVLRGEIDAETGDLRLEQDRMRLPECEQAVWSLDGRSVWAYVGHDDSSTPGGNAGIERRTFPELNKTARWDGPMRETFENGKGQVHSLAANESWAVGGFRNGKMFCLRADDAAEATEVRRLSDQRILSVDASASADEAYVGLEDGRLLAVHLPDLTTTELGKYETSVSAVDLNADGTRLLSGTARGRLSIYGRHGSEWRPALEINLAKPIVSAGWADRSGETLSVRLEHERGVRLLRVPPEIWNRATGKDRVAGEIAGR